MSLIWQAIAGFLRFVPWQAWIATAVLAGVTWAVLGLEHHGAKECRVQAATEARALESAETNAVTARNSAVIPLIVAEGTTYATAIARPVIDAPTVLVRVRNRATATDRLRTPPTPGQCIDHPSAPRTDGPWADIGGPLVTDARDSDAQINGLIDYVNDVCRAAPVTERHSVP
jgi:hypothetical protein